MRFPFFAPLISLLILLSPGIAQQDVDASAPQNIAGATAQLRGKVEITGQVVDASSGQPLKKTWINARSSERGARNAMTTVTDAEGHFDFKNLEPGRYQLIAQRNGYVRQSYGEKAQGEAGTPITVAAGQSSPTLCFAWFKAESFPAGLSTKMESRWFARTCWRSSSTIWRVNAS